MVSKNKAGPKKKPAPRKKPGTSKKRPLLVVAELKKVMVGIVILVSVCLTAAMIADLFFHPGRPEKKQVVERPVDPSKIKPVQEDMVDPRDKTQAEGLK